MSLEAAEEALCAAGYDSTELVPGPSGDAQLMVRVGREVVDLLKSVRTIVAPFGCCAEWIGYEICVEVETPEHKIQSALSQRLVDEMLTEVLAEELNHV
jgi:hypothetical protein